MTQNNTTALGDFSEPFLGSDVIFLVDGKQLHFSRFLLAHSSPVFHSWFFGEGKYSDTTSPEISLPGEQFDEFLEFLGQLHPDCVPQVTSKNVELLLKLGDRYIVRRVLSNCLSYLKTMKPVSDEPLRFLHLTFRYKLKEVSAIFMKHSCALSVNAIIDFYEHQDATEADGNEWHVKAALFNLLLFKACSTYELLDSCVLCGNNKRHHRCWKSRKQRKSYPYLYCRDSVDEDCMDKELNCSHGYFEDFRFRMNNQFNYVFEELYKNCCGEIVTDW